MNYYIYHIPGVKIGCTNNIERRVVKQQGFTEYEILEIHTDDKIASIREKELQKQYGLEELNVKTDYSQQVRFAKAGRDACKGKPNKGTQRQIKNKIGIFGYSKEERLALNTKANIIRAQKSAEKRMKPVIVFDYKSDRYIGEWKSIQSASIELKACNLDATICGRRKSANGYYAKLK
jgi:hypothetical protein